MLTVKPFTK